MASSAQDHCSNVQAAVSKIDVTKKWAASRRDCNPFPDSTDLVWLLALRAGGSTDADEPKDDAHDELDDDIGTDDEGEVLSKIQPDLLP